MIKLKKKMKEYLFCLFSMSCVISFVITCFYWWVGQENFDVESQNVQSDELVLENKIEDKFEDTLLEMENSLNEIQSESKLLQKRYSIISMLEEKENQVAKDICPDIMYQKYFRLRQGELARLNGIEDAEQSGCFGLLNSHFSGITFLIEEDMWVQYGNKTYLEEYKMPDTLLIMNSDINLGFMGARAGMNFEEIQRNAYENEIKTGFMYTSDWKLYYIEFVDENYIYKYISESPDGKDSWLQIQYK